MANGFDSSKITRQLRSPRNLLEFADVSIQPRQSTTAEVIANTLDDAFERASQTYLQGKQLDAQVQQQQIQSDLRREQLDIEQDRYQKSEDRATDNVLMDGLKDIDLKSEVDRLEARTTIGEISDPKLRRILTSRLDVSEVGATRLSKFEEIFQGENINEILTKKYTFEGEEKEGKKLLDEYMAINPTGKGMFGVSKDKMLMDMTAKYRGNAEYYDLAYGKFENEKGDEVSHIDVLFDSDEDKKTFRALNPIDGSRFLSTTLTKKGITEEQKSILSGFRTDIRNANDGINKKLGQINSDAFKPDVVIRLKKDIVDLENQIKVSKQNIDNFYKKLGFKTSISSDDNQKLSKSDIVSKNINSFKSLNTTEKQSFLQNHPQLSQIKTIINDYTSQDKSLSLTNPEFLDSLSKIGVFDDTIKTTQGFPSISNQSENVVQKVIEDDSPALADVARPSIPVPTSAEQFQPTDVNVPSFDATFDNVQEFQEPLVTTPRNIEDNPNEYIANNPVTASGTVSKDINKFLKETERLQKFRNEGQSQAIINNQNKKVKELQNKIKSRFFGYISGETGNFSNQNYTDNFYNSLSRKTKQSPQRLKTLMQIITSSR